MHLAVMTYTLKRDYIPLSRITYQAFGLDKTKHRFRDALFLARLKGFCLGAARTYRLAYARCPA